MGSYALILDIRMFCAFFLLGEMIHMGFFTLMAWLLGVVVRMEVFEMLGFEDLRI